QWRLSQSVIGQSRHEIGEHGSCKTNHAAPEIPCLSLYRRRFRRRTPSSTCSSISPSPSRPASSTFGPRRPPRPVTSGSASSPTTAAPELIARVLAQHGRAEQRCRLLPARLVVNAILLMCLKPTVSYQKLMYQLNAAVPASQSWTAPSRSAFAQARQRLGWEVMESLFRAQ